MPAQRPARRLQQRSIAGDQRWNFFSSLLLAYFAVWLPEANLFYLFCDDDASHYVKTNLWPGQGVVVAGLGSGLAVPANAFVPRAVLIHSLAFIVITNVPSLFHCFQPTI